MSDYEKELDDLLEGVYHRGNTDGLNDEWNPDNLGDAKAKLSDLLRRVEVKSRIDEWRRIDVGVDISKKYVANRLRKLEAEL